VPIARKSFYEPQSCRRRRRSGAGFRDSHPADAKKPSSGDPDLVTARQLFFGIENVNPKSGDVDRTR